MRATCEAEKMGRSGDGGSTLCEAESNAPKEIAMKNKSDSLREINAQLLNALEVLVVSASGAGSWHIERHARDLAEALDAARAAIAKARGEDTRDPGS
jgi:hypothetical protein